MIRFFIALLFLFSFRAFGTPDNLHVVFLSAKKTSFLIDLTKPKMCSCNRLLASNDDQEIPEDCMPMGDGCFHPQHGFIGKQPFAAKKRPDKGKDFELETFNADKVGQIECQEGAYFDIYCGKEKKEPRRSPSKTVEIWFDTSSSMKRVDFSSEQDFCGRREFLSSIKNTCDSKKLKFSVFDTSIKEMSTADTVCMTYGLNDQDRLIRWIKASEARYLLIITDIDEQSIKLKTFLDSVGAHIHGVGSDFTTKHLLDFTGQVGKWCKKV